MSCGQKAYDEDMEKAAWKEHHDRIAQLGPSEIIKIVERLAEHFRYLEESLSSLPRNGWYRVDEIKKELGKLK